LFALILSSCSSTGNFKSITSAYHSAHKRLFSTEQVVEEQTVDELRQQLHELEKEKEMLNNHIKALNREIQKKDVAISLQGKVIRLLDDTDHTLQKSIEAQIADQSVETDYTVSLPEN